MPDININGFNFVTQAGTTEPQITNNVVFPAGHVIKVSEFKIPRGSYSTSPTWPLDDTRPQYNEGVTIFSQNYTPTSAASKLFIQVFNIFMFESTNIADSAAAGLFISGTNDCLAVFPGFYSEFGNNAQNQGNVNGSHLMDSYTGQKTFYIQKGTAHQDVGVWFTNGYALPASRFDGGNNQFGRVTITEIS